MKHVASALIFCCLFMLPRMVRAAGIDDINPTLDSDHDGFPDVLELQAGYSPYNSAPIRLEKTIYVSIKNQTLSYYTGPYLVRTIKISSGIPGKDTPRGTFTILKKILVVDYKGATYDFPNTKWNMLFKHGSWGGYYIHGAYWHHNFGHKMSHGCVNVSYKDMEPIYAWTPTSTQVIIE